MDLLRQTSKIFDEAILEVIVQNRGRKNTER